MKPHTLPVKRRPVQKGMLRRLSAVTTRRKQHVAATADADMDLDDGSSKISRALTIIFLIHIVAIGLIFVHQKFLDGRAPEEQKTAAVTATKDSPAVAAPAARRQDVPRLSSGEKPYIVRAGDNYTRIAAAEGVDEGDLKRVNQHVDIGPGLILKIPPKRPAAEAPQMAASISDAMVVPTGSNELVDAVDVSNAPRATLVRGKVAEQAKAAAPAAKPSASSGKTHVIQNGESIWKIANRYKVNQADLMKINGISDPRKVKAGMNLTIP